MPNVKPNINVSIGIPKTEIPDSVDMFHELRKDGKALLTKAKKKKFSPVNKTPPKTAFLIKFGLTATAATDPTNMVIETQYIGFRLVRKYRGKKITGAVASASR